MAPITIKTLVKAPLAIVWDAWNNPKHIPGWAFAMDTWEAYGAENDLKVGGKFKTTMAAKDKSVSFDFGGTYTAVQDNALLEYDMDDARHVKVTFAETPEGIEVTETFDPESLNSEEMQRAGWQAILDNFKKYTETLSA